MAEVPSKVKLIIKTGNWPKMFRPDHAPPGSPPPGGDDTVQLRDLPCGLSPEVKISAAGFHVGNNQVNCTPLVRNEPVTPSSVRLVKAPVAASNSQMSLS
jgi:hypothetical protein